MKKISKLLMPCFAMLGILFLGTAEAQTDKTKTKDQMQAAKGTYTATYSSKFEIGNAALTQVIVNLWKDWDADTLDQSAGMFADTLTMYFPDGSMVKGKDQNLAEGKKYRGQFKAVKSTIHALVSLKSVDHNENWVAIWGTEEDTAQDGKITQVSLHEIWRFNKDGKIDVMRQFQAKVPEAQ